MLFRSLSTHLGTLFQSFPAMASSRSKLSKPGHPADYRTAWTRSGPDYPRNVPHEVNTRTNVPERRNQANMFSKLIFGLLLWHNCVDGVEVH